MKSSSPRSPSLMTTAPASKARTSTTCMTRSSSRSARRAKSGILASTSRLSASLRARSLSLGVALAEAHHDGGDVVLAARFVGELDERRDGASPSVLVVEVGLELVGVRRGIRGARRTRGGTGRPAGPR